jgi:RimJ/RimL family protein N-acetyltransferase
MRARPISPGEIDRFVENASDPEHREDQRGYLESMFSAGSMRPEWCYIVEDRGRVALWTLPGVGEPLAIVLLDVAWNEDPGPGNVLLETILEDARALGAEELEHVLDSPPMWPQWQHFPKERTELLERAGFTLRRETSRFEWRSEDGLPPATGRLGFRSLEEVGEAAFVDAIERVSEGTLDREISAEREELGAAEAARRFFELELQLEHDPAWCQLAYAPPGDLVGLIMPARNPTSPVINYVGVVPEHRGNGYVDDLLARGTEILASTGATSIRADTDTRNAPMADAFERAGYSRFARRREYAVKLTAR